MRHTPRILTAGDGVIVAEFGDGIDAAVNARVHRVARAVDAAAHVGIVETVPTYRSLAVHFDPRCTTPREVERAICDADSDVRSAPSPPPRTVEIPVHYGGDHGPDLPDVAAHCGLDEVDVVAIHAAGAYRVFMMGFTPGFPYLGGLSPRIAAPRLATPRTSVPGGSVGIAGTQTGVYPTTSPGGWRLIGWTPSVLFDPAANPPTLLDAGDLVRFVAVTGAPTMSGLVRPPEEIASGDPSKPAVDVLDGGFLTTVQDLGRVGCQRCGVPVAGAMDPWSLRAANRLVGNPDGHAALELTLSGPTLRFDTATVVALCGADAPCALNGVGVRVGRAFRVRPGDVLRCGQCRDGLRAILAIAGGIDVPLVLGSRSTYLPSAFGGFSGRPLRTGDRVPLGGAPPVGPVSGRRIPDRASRREGGVCVVRVMPGPQDDAFTAAGIETFYGSTYSLSPRSDRVGCRFDGPRVAHREGADIVSDATAFGSVQIAGDGLPIVLMADRGTTGGYTKVATVISADLPRLAQAAPGTSVRFQPVDAGAAALAREERERWLETIGATPAAEGDEIFDEDRGGELAADGVAALAAVLDGPATTARRSVAGVRAGMVGVVVAVSVEAGTYVAARDTVAVVEAMKMQNPVRSAAAGRVRRVCVAMGEHVSAETIVVEFED